MKATYRNRDQRTHSGKLLLLGGLLMGLLAPESSAAPANAKAFKTIDSRVETDFVFTVGRRVDDLKWNIAGNIYGSRPNILSELTWSDIQSVQVRSEASVVLPNVISLKAYADYGWITDGDNQDSDYFGDNRTFEFSRSNNNADGTSVSDASIALGYPIRFGDQAIATITPLIGYSYHEQNLTLTDGYQTVPNLGPFSGLDSSYDTEWDGAWMGWDLRFRARELSHVPGERIESYFTVEYHKVDYSAVADWNLRTDFQHPVSYRHDANGDGWKLTAGMNYWLNKNLAVNASYDYLKFTTDGGLDTTYLSNGTTGFTRLNEVKWYAYALNIGIALRF